MSSPNDGRMNTINPSSVHDHRNRGMRRAHTHQGHFGPVLSGLVTTRPQNTQQNQPLSNSEQDGGQGEQNGPETTTTQDMVITQGPVPFLPAENPYIKRGEFDEDAAPFSGGSNSNYTLTETSARQVNKKPSIPRSKNTAHDARDTHTGCPRAADGSSWPRSGLHTPSREEYDNSRPVYKSGALATLLKLGRTPISAFPMAFGGRFRRASAPETTSLGSGARTPLKWYKSSHMSTAALLAGTSAQLADAYVGLSGGDNQPTRLTKPKRGYPSGVADVLGRFSRAGKGGEMKASLIFLANADRLDRPER
ncbi:hypothetical protein Dda_7775 [Drechslerella dactyloides]|uniref:Uncharacterized protein n=1 Tax=Drechslerella dactyloides TaxID=74499 RepID=A0AAD6IUQ2_DREDA|nr:hypothetical protein Dda_7775 [Drechslerella dactyloides]